MAPESPLWVVFTAKRRIFGTHLKTAIAALAARPRLQRIPNPKGCAKIRCAIPSHPALEDQALRDISRSGNRNRISSVRALSTLFALIIVLAGQTQLSAQGPFYALIVNGSPNLLINYDGSYLFVRGFRRAVRAAGAPSSYVRNVPPGTAAWLDRPLNDQEPLTLKQRMSPEQARPAIERLRQNGGFWKFYCRNTGAGYFEVSRSEAAYASVRID